MPLACQAEFLKRVKIRQNNVFDDSMTLAQFWMIDWLAAGWLADWIVAGWLAGELAEAGWLVFVAEVSLVIAAVRFVGTNLVGSCC